MDAGVRTGAIKGVTREQIRSAAAEKSVMCVAKTEGSSKRRGASYTRLLPGYMRRTIFRFWFVISPCAGGT